MHRIAATLLPFLLLSLGACGGTDAPTRGADPIAEVTVGAGPVGVSAGPSGDIWVADARRGSVRRIPAGAKAADLTTDVKVPLRLTVADGGVWVTSFEDGALVRIDAATGKVTDRLRIGKGAEGVTAAYGALWAVAQDDGRLVRVDLDRRKVVRRIDVGVGVRLVKAGADALWLNDYPNNRLVRVDPTTGRVRHSGRLCAGPQDMVASGDVVWVTCSLGDELVAVDAHTLKVTRRAPLAGTPDAIAAGPHGNLLVVLQAGPALATVDPDTGRTITRRVLGKQGQLHDQANLDLARSDGHVWVSSFLEGTLYRVPEE